MDDNKKIRSLIKIILQKDGHNIIEAGNGLSGIKVFLEKRPDVVLMDIRMEGLDGIDATRVIRQESSEVKIIIVTDYNEEQLRRKAKKAGADGYLLKENLLSLKEMLKN